VSLREYLDLVSKRGGLAELHPLDPIYEVAKLLKEYEGGPTVVFNIRRFQGWRGAGNLLDTRNKLYLALGVSNDVELYELILSSELKASQVNALDEVSSLSGDYKCVEPKLTSLPMAKYYEMERGPYLTSAVVVGVDRDSGVLNASIHRLSPISEDRAVIRLVPRHLYAIHQRNLERGAETPIGIAWGVHPAVLISAASSPPLGVFELNMAGLLLGKLKVYRLDNGAVVPYGAEVIMEGRITGELAEEGPFVDVLGTYDRVRLQPVVKIDKICVRDNPIAHYLLPAGKEHKLLMSVEKEAKIWSAVRGVVPRVVKVRLTEGGGSWLHAVISIEKRVEGDSKNAIIAAFAAHPSLKHVVVVDEDVDPDNPQEVEWALATRFRADRGLFVIPYARGSSLDPTALNEEGLTFKVGFDATIPVGADRSKFIRARIP